MGPSPTARTSGESPSTRLWEGACRRLDRSGNQFDGVFSRSARNNRNGLEGFSSLKIAEIYERYDEGRIAEECGKGDPIRQRFAGRNQNRSDEKRYCQQQPRQGRKPSQDEMDGQR